jgi:hypothetical protein
LVTVIPTLDEAKLFYFAALAVIGSTMFCFKSAKRFPAPERASPALPIPTPQGRPEARGLVPALGFCVAGCVSAETEIRGRRVG